MAQELIKISDLFNSQIFPVARSKMIRLIKNGELAKVGKLPEGKEYLIAMNIGNGEKNASWVVSREEVDEWQQRARNKSILSDNAS